MATRRLRGVSTDTRATLRSIPDSKIITATAVTSGNACDAEPAEALLDDMLGE